jgi:beta-mannosidase
MTRRGTALLAAAAAVASASCGRAPGPAVRIADLDCMWWMRGQADTVWVPATVPGTVHTDLLAAGRIPDPFKGTPEGRLAGIEDEDWIYRCDFDVDPLPLEEAHVDLVFEGLDTYADVTLNSTVVLRADNQFRTWRVDVRDALRVGSNIMLVRFGNAVREGHKDALANPWPIPHQEPDETLTRAFTRKAAYQFGWDWGPRYVTSGIWRPVHLEAWSGARIVDAWAGPPTWVGDTARVPVNVTLEANGGRALRLGFHSPDGSFAAVVRKVPAPPAGQPVQVETILTIPAAQAWWPRGMGEPVGRLYDVGIDLAQGRRWDRATRRIGLRTVRLVTEPDSVGESFRFEVNGRPVFARGANLVPPDHFTPRADSATYARILDDAVRANMNMLRVWGGGIYLPDVFYDLADERGVLVWQDFMFANTLVPGDPAFARSVQAEATDQVRRLRRHPSLALWCGNNEIAEGWANWGWREEYDSATAGLVDAAYRRIFEDILPTVVHAEDPTTSYVPSSPRLGWGHPESLTEGDSHYWGVWWGMEPFRAYAEKIPRFASEFGFQALPAPATLAAFGDPSPTSLDDPVVWAHEKHATGFQTIRTYLERAWPVPADDSLDAWSYVTQLAQAEGVGLALEAHRRSWPRTGGTLFWQLNDTWPVVSWSSIDYFGRWKALQYEARRVFAPVAVLADRWADTLAVWVAADTAVAGTLRVRVVDFDGRELTRRDVPVSGGGLAWRGSRGSLLPAGADPRGVVVLAELRAPGGGDGPILAKDRAFFVEPKDLALPDPGLRLVSAEPDGDAWTVAVTATRFACAVRLTVDGVGARYSENFVDLLPGDTLRVRVVPEAPTPDLAGRVRLRSLGGASGQ